MKKGRPAADAKKRRGPRRQRRLCGRCAADPYCFWAGPAHVRFWSGAVVAVGKRCGQIPPREPSYASAATTSVTDKNAYWAVPQRASDFNMETGALHRKGHASSNTTRKIQNPRHMGGFVWFGCGGSQPALFAPRSCGSLGWTSVVAGACNHLSLQLTNLVRFNWRSDV